MLTTDQSEIALLDVRVLAFDTVLVESPPAEADADSVTDSTTHTDG
jgi:hypothetical protein